MNPSNTAGEPRAPYGELPSDADPDIRGSMKAMHRAAQRAREIARQTGTDLILVRDGRVVRVKPESPDAKK